jgi:tripartite ATP-independent transporter DctP family solute receptor
MLKKVLLTIGLCSFIVMSLFVNTPLVKAGKPIVLKVGNGDPSSKQLGNGKDIEFHSYACMVGFKNSLEKLSKGRIKVEVYPYGRIGYNKSLLEQILAGTFNSEEAIGAFPSDGQLAQFYKNMQVLSIPYMFTSYKQAYSVMDGKFVKRLLNDMAKKSGLRMVSVISNGGFRCFTNNKRPIKSVADMKGLKIRSVESPAYMEMIKALGATPTPIAWSEIYTAFQTNVVDGQENSAVTMVCGSLQEVQKYYTVDNHIFGIAGLILSERWLRTLPKNLQTAVIKAGKEAQKVGRAAVARNEKIVMDYLKESKMNIYVPNAKELKTFKKAQAPVIKWVRASIDNPKWVDKMLAAAKAAEK